MMEHIPMNPNIAGIVMLPPSVSLDMKNISASAKNTVALNISSNANTFKNFDFGIYKYIVLILLLCLIRITFFLLTYYFLSLVT